MRTDSLEVQTRQDRKVPFEKAVQTLFVAIRGLLELIIRSEYTDQAWNSAALLEFLVPEAALEIQILNR